jgi:hypothetical protein
MKYLVHSDEHLTRFCKYEDNFPYTKVYWTAFDNLESAIKFWMKNINQIDFYFNHPHSLSENEIKIIQDIYNLYKDLL